jgi:hypothetical protein
MIFFRFSRPLRIRNWDILLLFVLAVPLLYLRDREELRGKLLQYWAGDGQVIQVTTDHVQRVVAAPVGGAETALLVSIAFDQHARHQEKTLRGLGFYQHDIWRGYLGLLIASALLMVRSLVDLGMDRKGEFRPNLTTGGLIWLACVLMAIMAIKPFLPEWSGVPKQQHESVFLTYLQETLTSSYLFPFSLSVISHTLIIAMLILIGVTIFRNAIIGAAAAVLYLLLPYTALLLTHATQVVASVFVLLAVLGYRRPTVAGLSLGIGTCLGFYPIILVPAWFSFYFRRGHWRFLVTFLALIIAMVTFVTITQGLSQAWDKAWNLAEWQGWKFALRPTADSLWNTVSLHVAYRIPLFILFLALVVTSAFWPHPKNLGQLISWSAVLILGVQFWYADAGGIYILWYLPLVILQTLRPSLTQHRAADIEPEHDPLSRFLRWAFPRRYEPAPEHKRLPPPTAMAG